MHFKYKPCLLVLLSLTLLGASVMAVRAAEVTSTPGHE
jgi:hypothetical protein